MGFSFKVGQELPPDTVSGDFFSNPTKKYTSIEDVDPDSWFFANRGGDSNA